MSNSDLIKSVLNALLPRGAIWEYKEQGDLDKLLSGIADNAGAVQDYLGELAYIRYPDRTPVLSDLELDYDIRPDDTLTDAERRNQLSTVFPRRTSGTAEYMEGVLREAGFDVYVHRNNPPINALGYGWTIFGNDDAVFGRDDAQFGGDEAFWPLLVNADPQDAEYAPCDAECTGFWAGVFFIGGLATRDGSGFITHIDTANVPMGRRSFFERLIMNNKPMHTWAMMVLEYV